MRVWTKLFRDVPHLPAQGYISLTSIDVEKLITLGLYVGTCKTGHPSHCLIGVQTQRRSQPAPLALLIRLHVLRLQTCIDEIVDLNENRRQPFTAFL